MCKYIVMSALFCLLPGCAGQSLPSPPPPPMPFTVAWAPDEAPALQVTVQTLLPLMQNCNGGKLAGKKNHGIGISRDNFFQQASGKRSNLASGQTVFFGAGQNGIYHSSHV